jgi:hypothetical protein
MMLVHIFALLTDVLFGGWEQMEWLIASHICDSLLGVIRNR